MRGALAEAASACLDGEPVAFAYLFGSHATGRVREHGQLVYCRDDVQRVRYESLIGRMYHDSRIHEERSARELLARLAEGRRGDDGPP